MDGRAAAVTGAAYLILLILIWKSGKKKIKNKEKRKRIRRGICFFLLVNTISVIVFIWTGQERPVKDGKLGRSPKGSGSRSETVFASVEGVCENVPVQVRVDDQAYTREEVEEILSQESERLEQRILGENQTVDHVTSDLNLVSSISDYPITVQWSADSYEYMSIDGSLRENIPKAGTAVHLKAVLTFEQGMGNSTEKIWEDTVTLYPPQADSPEEIAALLKQMVDKENENSREESALRLPDEISGRKVSWQRKTEVNGYQVMGIGVLIFVSAAAWRRQKASEAVKVRKEQLRMDYPEILEQFSLLIGAGMTVKSAWYKIVDNYQERQERCGKRTAYEEMIRTCFEMQGGVPEGEGYENFGKRCQIQEYMRLGLLLSQNLKKGTRGLTELLSLEAVHAFEDRKARAKRKGEETGTKLLVPMIMMLAVVLVIVIVPAFWSMGI